MSSILATIGRLVATWFAAERGGIHPDEMSLHDWADLPSHHPLCD
ncbi:MAG: hypothetical protein P0Y65_17975 [Candidatus Devosia phytovorans]|uniref:Uncharacterized protein n=1 Tax=Candidatus Devosia phytovorans TaxID=3121372 RepID=A0AAJ5VUA1_9HYPH|nr:hypothetical protein [Devosia sp.]WEK04050.1 MAG: hypothetical protein P0Y65_17975 [Devosia sp.]